MDRDRAAQARGGWMRRHRRTLVVLVMLSWLAPMLLFAASVLWLTARIYPGFAAAAVLALLLLAVRIRRSRLPARRCAGKPERSASPSIAGPL